MTQVSSEFSAEAARYEKEVDKTQRAIAKVEDNLDETISTHKNTQGRGHKRDLFLKLKEKTSNGNYLDVNFSKCE